MFRQNCCDARLPFLLNSLTVLGLIAQVMPSLAGTPQTELTAIPASTTSTSAIAQVTSVSQLSDVQPGDWAFQALQSLVERYGCIAGYPNGSFQGHRALSRYEFAAGLNACLNSVNELIAAAREDAATREDLVTLQRLQEDFAAELATFRGRVDTLEARAAELEANQFSTTTKLNGEVLFAVNAGSFSGDRIVDARGQELANDDPNATVLYRSALILNTSFSGTDNLRILLDTGSDAGTDNAAGFLEPSFGSVLDFSVKPPTEQRLGLSRLFYTFKPLKDVTVSVGPNIRTTDYIDRNSYANRSNQDFSTLALVNNYILFPIFGPSAGAAIEWNPQEGPLTVRTLYAASDAGNPGTEGPSTGVSLFTNVLYSPPGSSEATPGTPPPAPRSDRGLFGDTYQAAAELEYALSTNFTLRLHYSGGQIFDNSFNAFGANIELALSPRFALFARYGYGDYNDTAFGDINPSYWMAGTAFPDLLKQGALAGFAAGQPFITSDIGNGTQTNFEAFYRYPLNDNIHITPVIQVILDSANQNSNGTIVTGTLRTVFTF